MNDYARSLLRFWWVLVIGLAVAPAAAIMAVYKVDFSSMPAVADGARAAELLGAGTAARHRRRRSRTSAASITTLQAVAADAEGTPRAPPGHVRAGHGHARRRRRTSTRRFIESDPVAEIREEIFGPNDGELRAQALLRGLEPEPVRALARPGDPADRRRRHAEEGDRPRHAHEHRVHQVAAAEPAARRGSRPKQRITVVALQTPKSADGVRRRVIDAAGARLRRRADGVRRARAPLRPDVPAAARGAGSGGGDGARAGADERVTRRTH